VGPFSYTDDVVRKTLTDWFEPSGELFVELHLPHSGGSGFFYILSTFADYLDLMMKAKPGAVSFVLRDRQFPLRGVIDDVFIANTLEHVDDGEYYMIIEPLKYPLQFDVLGDGNTHSELKNDLETLRGKEVWAGLDLKMPNDYWQENLAEDALIALKPE
jgi:hypothetical protein